jgi:hypothetical protein
MGRKRLLVLLLLTEEEEEEGEELFCLTTATGLQDHTLTRFTSKKLLISKNKIP